MIKQLVATVLCVSMLLTGCDSTDTNANATYRVQSIASSGTGAGGEAPVRIKLSTGGDVAQADLSSIVAFVQIVAKREATKRQAIVAAQRARATVARMNPGQRAKTRYIAVETERSAPNFDSQPATYVEGPTSAARGPAPAFERSVMLWDTQTQTLVGNAVYDIKSTPPKGSSARFESFTAQYVGAGL